MNAQPIWDGPGITDGRGLIARIARKEWVCTCFEPVHAYIIEWKAPAGSRLAIMGTSGEMPYTATNAEIMAKCDAIRKLHHGIGKVEISVRPNPNHRPDCKGAIKRGNRYIEYVGEAMAYESGTRYCWPCATAVWGPG